MARKSSWPDISSTQEQVVLSAVHANDIPELQKLSLLPGGFGNARAQAWPYLLDVDTSVERAASTSNSHGSPDHDQSQASGLSDSWAQSPGFSAPSSPVKSHKDLQDSFLDEAASQFFSEGTELTPHPDEHQVQLDTDRSFVLYPVVERPMVHRKHLQEDLHDLILQVLRKRPRLRYFQGYHDIMTVLFLTLPTEVVFKSAEKISLHRLRDSMGSGLEPLVSQLRVLKRLLRMVDPPYAEVLERNSPLPYYALSNLLTLFAHDVPTLPLIQHVFDWLLCREPIAVIWLAAAVLLIRKEDVLALEQRGDDAMGMMHAVLSALPELSEDKTGNRSGSDFTEAKQILEDESCETTSIPVDGPREEGNVGPIDESLSSESPLMDSWTAESPRASSPPILVSAIKSRSSSSSDQAAEDPLGNLDEKTDLRTPETEPDVTCSRTQTHSRSPSHSTPRSLPGEFKEKIPNPPLSLPTLLSRASDLLTAFPPSSPSLRLSETFGAQSAMRTGGFGIPEAVFNLQDDEAETYVGGDNVVLPLSQEEEDEEFGTPKRSKESTRTSDRGKSRHGQPIRIVNGLAPRRQTVVASVVLLLGVAVALYGFSPGGRGASRSGHGRFGSSDMRWVVAWMGGLVGMGERLGIGL